MAKEIAVSALTNLVIYFKVRNSANLIWNTSSVAFEAFNGANIANYAVLLTEDTGSGDYCGDFPAGIVTAGAYRVYLCIRPGGSAALGDAKVGSGTVFWDGAKEVSTADINTRVSLALPNAAPNTSGGSRSSVLANGTMQAGSTSTTAVLAAGDTGTSAAYVGALLQITGGTGIGQTRTIAAYNAGTKTVTLAAGRTFGVTPDNTTTYAVIAEGHPQINDALQVVASSVVGAVGSVTGAVASVTGAVGSVTGNVGGSVGSVTGAVGSVTAPVVTTDHATILANLNAAISTRATPADVTAALVTAGLVAANQLALYTQSGSSVLSGNVATFTSPDGLHTGTLTAAPNWAAPTSQTWVQLT